MCASQLGYRLRVDTLILVLLHRYGQIRFADIFFGINFDFYSFSIPGVRGSARYDFRRLCRLRRQFQAHGNLHKLETETPNRHSKLQPSISDKAVDQS